MMQIFHIFGQVCQPPSGGLFGLPTWYKYLDGYVDPTGNCSVTINRLSDAWLILAAVLEILLRLSALAALVMILWSGFMFISSEGQPDKTKKALTSVINASVGLVIAVSATAVLTFIAGRF